MDEPLKFVIFAREALGLVPLTLGAECLRDPVTGADYSICRQLPTTLIPMVTAVGNCPQPPLTIVLPAT